MTDRRWSLAAGRGGEHQQHLRLVLGDQGLPVDGDLAELRVHEGLRIVEALADLVQPPHVAELVDRVRFLRFAEVEGRYDDVLALPSAASGGCCVRPGSGRRSSRG